MEATDFEYRLISHRQAVTIEHFNGSIKKRIYHHKRQREMKVKASSAFQMVLYGGGT